MLRYGVQTSEFQAAGWGDPYRSEPLSPSLLNTWATLDKGYQCSHNERRGDLGDDVEQRRNSCPKTRFSTAPTTALRSNSGTPKSVKTPLPGLCRKKIQKNYERTRNVYENNKKCDTMSDGKSDISCLKIRILESRHDKKSHNGGYLAFPPSLAEGQAPPLRGCRATAVKLGLANRATVPNSEFTTSETPGARLIAPLDTKTDLIASRERITASG